VEITTHEMPELKLEQIISAYVGKPHKCMCGCSGEYYYTKANQKLGSEERGYEVTDDEVNDKKVMRVVNRMTKNASEGIEILSSGSKLIITGIVGQTQYTVYTV